MLAYDLNEDFKEIKTIFIEEKLEEEELKDGLVEETYEVKVALTSHAVNRGFSLIRGRDYVVRYL